MTPDQAEQEIRKRVLRFRAMSPHKRVRMEAREYAHARDCDVLLALVDALRRVIAHAPTAPSLPALPDPLRGATLPTAPTIPAVELPWSDAANRG